MASLDSEVAQIRRPGALGYWGERIYHQVAYAARLSRLRQGQYDELLHAVNDFLLRAQAAEGAITRRTAEEAETRMRGISQDAKRLTVLCVAHAHIDMNWQWRWDETAAVTLDTFRTMLDLMREYPDFRFSQSQASTYRIVEAYAPEMLPEIRNRIREGRWEVTASTWVEADKNLPNGESLARHILYTKRYLSELLELDAAALTIDFEPDTFGHSLEVPEILASGGVKYYYHCRGYDGHDLYRWVAPSGASVLAYRDPVWYLGAIQPDLALNAPDFCARQGLETMLKVYGVGDHGGGPTRRDLERIRDMNTWPVFPTFRFGTFRDYFAEAETIADRLPTVQGELNFVFTGCYTTQTRIKKANRVAEATLYDAELFDAAGRLVAEGGYPDRKFDAAWRNVLFNQFHDIVTGSGVVDTREYAMGLFQDTMATANTGKALAMRGIAAQVDTSALGPKAGEAIAETVSEGAGVGFGAAAFKISQPDRGRGTTRTYVLFNPAPVTRHEAVEVVLWDWPGEVGRMQVQDAEGSIVAHQILTQGTQYWGHRYHRILIQAAVPPCGYATYVLSESEESDLSLAPSHLSDQRVERESAFVLENRLIRVVFNSRTGSIVSMRDRVHDRELVRQGVPAGIFRLIREDDSQGMTSWRVGRYMQVEDLTENVRIRKLSEAGSLRQAIELEMEFSHSKLTATISLDTESPWLRYEVECDWREIGRRGEGVPQLGFYLPVAYECERFLYDVPFGVAERPGLDMDVPASSFAVATNKDAGGRSIMLVSDCKYGFRGHSNALSVTLIRGAFDPDPHPDFGKQTFQLWLSAVGDEGSHDLISRSFALNHPINAVSAAPSAGTLPVEQSFLRIEEGSVALSAVKVPEAPAAAVRWLVRLYETDGRRTRTVLRFGKEVAHAHLVDLNEKPVAGGGEISNDGQGGIGFWVAPFTIVGVVVEFSS